MSGKRESNSNEKSTSSPKRPRKFYVQVSRKPEVQKSRQELPVFLHEQEIIEAIHEHDVILISGATGTGKTTQVPQFLIEDGFGHVSSPTSSGLIAVTQPRRVAAITCAKRVAHELNTPLGKSGGLVGYQVRHDSRLSNDTRVKFSTDGILLREVEHDILLKKYSAIIIDEAHERSLNTDLLLSFLSRSVLLRRAKKNEHGLLKVIIMSATLDVDGILSGKRPLFPNPPVIKIPSRQFPITIHFAKRTFDDYVEEAFRKVSQIHTRLPPGGILVFLSGREEVERLCTKLRTEFGDRKIRLNLSTSSTTPSSTTNPDPTSNDDLKKDSDDTKEKETPLSTPENSSLSTVIEIGMQVLPFYSLLPDNLQRRVFQTEKDSESIVPTMRKVVISTNIAETSVTVPDMAYVVDSGRAKEKVYKGHGLGRLSAYDISWISQASAEQRAGRAGRISAGHCYRLYSSAVYDQQFVEFCTPEILRMPTDSVVLRLRAMGIRHVSQFPFATAPPLDEIIAAEILLTKLGALTSASDSLLTSSSNAMLGVTMIGRMLATLPVEPRLGRLLLAAREDGKANTIALACRLGGVLSVGTMFQPCTDKDERNIQSKLRNTQSDLLTELAAVCAVEHAGRRNRSSGKTKNIMDTQAMRAMCTRFSLHTKCALEAIAVAKQVERTIGRFIDDSNNDDNDKCVRPPDRAGVEKLLRSVVAGFGDRIAKRMSRDEAAAAGVIPKLMSRAFSANDIDKPVFIESGSSVRFGRDVTYVCFSELVELEVKHSGDDIDHDDYDDNDESSDDEYEGNTHEVINVLNGKGEIDKEEEKDMEKLRKKKENMKKKIAKMNGGTGNIEKRIVMRGVSIIEGRWVIEEAEGMCDMNVIREVDPEYNERLESVSELMCVRYKGRGWILGRKRVSVDEAERRWNSQAVSQERRKLYFNAFSKAFVNGEVNSNIRLSKNEGRLEVCIGRIGDLMGQWNVNSLDALIRNLSSSPCLIKEILEVVDVCCHSKFRNDAVKRWKRELGRLVHVNKVSKLKAGGVNDEAFICEREEKSSDDDY